MSLNIAKDSKKRVVIVGGGFGGLKLANKLKKSGFQVVLIDKNNYHQFPPLIYQVASAGMEPTSISFPFRKIFQHRKDFYFRMAEVRAVFPEKNMIQTSIGKAEYDYLVLAAGTTTNFFGNKHIEEEAMPMKNVSEACCDLLQQTRTAGVAEYRCRRWWCHGSGSGGSTFGNEEICIAE